HTYSRIALLHRHHRPTMFPYTTLFRSSCGRTPSTGLKDRSRFQKSVGSGARCGTAIGPSGPWTAYSNAAARKENRCPEDTAYPRSEEHTSELQSRVEIVCRLLLEKKKE